MMISIDKIVHQTLLLDGTDFPIDENKKKKKK